MNDMMESILAEKFDIDQTVSDWRINLYNEMCVAKNTIIESKKLICDLETELARLLPFEIFILNALNGDTSELFKTKLKKQLRENGFTVDRDKSGNYTVLKRLS